VLVLVTDRECSSLLSFPLVWVLIPTTCVVWWLLVGTLRSPPDLVVLGEISWQVLDHTCGMILAGLDAFDDIVSTLAHPDFTPHVVRHPSGIFAIRYATHLTAYHPSTGGDPLARVTLTEGRSLLASIEILDDIARTLLLQGVIVPVHLVRQPANLHHREEARDPAPDLW
jgi:hypothetical protein